MLWWIGAPVVAGILLFLIQGFLVQVSVALSGEPAPKYGRAMATWIVASLLGLVTSLVWGVSIGWFVPTAVSGVVSGLLMLTVATIVFKRQLGTSFVQAGAIALIYQLLAFGVSALTWYLVGWS